nr:uncharacterized protein LOC120967848 isoform X2 [Aegilops tauschii subsp. strangulata]
MEFHRPSQVPPEADRSDARLSAAAAALTASSTRRSPPPLPDSGRQLAEATSAPALTASSTRRSPPPLPDSGRQLAEATSAPGLTASRPLPDSRRQLAQATSAPALTTSPTGVSPPPRPLADSSRRLAQDTSSRAPALVIQSRGHASPSSPWPLLRGSRLVRSAAEPPALDEAVDEPPQAQRRRSFKNTDEPPQKQQRTPQKGVEPEQCRIEDRPKETKVNVHRGAPFPRCQICGRRVLTYYYKCCGQATCKDCQRACNCRFKTRLDVPRVKTGGGDLSMQGTFYLPCYPWVLIEATRQEDVVRYTYAPIAQAVDTNYLFLNAVTFSFDDGSCANPKLRCMVKQVIDRQNFYLPADKSSTLGEGTEDLDW